MPFSRCNGIRNASRLGACLVLIMAATGQADASARSALEQRVAHPAGKHGVPASLARAVIQIESTFQPRAANKGNYGLMQIRLETARSLGYRGGAAGLLDPETNLTWGMRYLAQAYRLAGGDTCGTVLRYQGGLRQTRMTAAARAYCSRARVLMAKAG
jgi:soluble lytic murein transglycosylase-like protein